VKPNLISAQGFGDASPVAPNDTAQGRAAKSARRIVASWIEWLNTGYVALKAIAFFGIVEMLLRPCCGGSNLRHVGLVEWDDVSSPF
jgi:hypothetical protein